MVFDDEQEKRGANESPPEDETRKDERRERGAGAAAAAGAGGAGLGAGAAAGIVAGDDVVELVREAVGENGDEPDLSEIQERIEAAQAAARDATRAASIDVFESQVEDAGSAVPGEIADAAGIIGDALPPLPVVDEAGDESPAPGGPPGGERPDPEDLVPSEDAPVPGGPPSIGQPRQTPGDGTETEAPEAPESIGGEGEDDAGAPAPPDAPGAPAPPAFPSPPSGGPPPAPGPESGSEDDAVVSEAPAPPAPGPGTGASDDVVSESPAVEEAPPPPGSGAPSGPEAPAEEDIPPVSSEPGTPGTSEDDTPPASEAPGTPEESEPDAPSSPDPGSSTDTPPDGPDAGSTPGGEPGTSVDYPYVYAWDDDGHWVDVAMQNDHGQVYYLRYHDDGSVYYLNEHGHYVQIEGDNLPYLLYVGDDGTAYFSKIQHHDTVYFSLDTHGDFDWVHYHDVPGYETPPYEDEDEYEYPRVVEYEYGDEPWALIELEDGRLYKYYDDGGAYQVDEHGNETAITGYQVPTLLYVDEHGDAYFRVFLETEGAYRYYTIDVDGGLEYIHPDDVPGYEGEPPVDDDYDGILPANAPAYFEHNGETFPNPEHDDSFHFVGNPTPNTYRFENDEGYTVIIGRQPDGSYNILWGDLEENDQWDLGVNLAADGGYEILHYHGEHYDEGEHYHPPVEDQYDYPRVIQWDVDEGWVIIQDENGHFGKYYTDGTEYGVDEHGNQLPPNGQHLDVGELLYVDNYGNAYFRGGEEGNYTYFMVDHDGGVEYVDAQDVPGYDEVEDDYPYEELVFPEGAPDYFEFGDRQYGNPMLLISEQVNYDADTGTTTYRYWDENDDPPGYNYVEVGYIGNGDYIVTYTDPDNPGAEIIFTVHAENGQYVGYEAVGGLYYDEWYEEHPLGEYEPVLPENAPEYFEFGGEQWDNPEQQGYELFNQNGGFYEYRHPETGEYISVNVLEDGSYYVNYRGDEQPGTWEINFHVYADGSYEAAGGVYYDEYIAEHPVDEADEVYPRIHQWDADENWVILEYEDGEYTKFYDYRTPHLVDEQGNELPGYVGGGAQVIDVAENGDAYLREGSPGDYTYFVFHPNGTYEVGIDPDDIPGYDYEEPPEDYVYPRVVEWDADQGWAILEVDYGFRIKFYENGEEYWVDNHGNEILATPGLLGLPYDLLQIDEQGYAYIRGGEPGYYYYTRIDPDGGQEEVDPNDIPGYDYEEPVEGGYDSAWAEHYEPPYGFEHPYDLYGQPDPPGENQAPNVYLFGGGQAMVVRNADGSETITWFSEGGFQDGYVEYKATVEYVDGQWVTTSTALPVELVPQYGILTVEGHQIYDPYHPNAPWGEPDSVTILEDRVIAIWETDEGQIRSEWARDGSNYREVHYPDGLVISGDLSAPWEYEIPDDWEAPGSDLLDGYLPDYVGDYIYDPMWPNPQTDPRFEFQYEGHPQGAGGPVTRTYHADVDDDGTVDYVAVVTESPNGTYSIDYGYPNGEWEAHIEVTGIDEDGSAQYIVGYAVVDPQGLPVPTNGAAAPPTDDEPEYDAQYVYDLLPDNLPEEFEGGYANPEHAAEYQYHSTISGEGDIQAMHHLGNNGSSIVVIEHSNGATTMYWLDVPVEPGTLNLSAIVARAEIEPDGYYDLTWYEDGEQVDGPETAIFDAIPDNLPAYFEDERFPNPEQGGDYHYDYSEGDVHYFMNEDGTQSIRVWTNPNGNVTMAWHDAPPSQISASTQELVVEIQADGTWETTYYSDAPPATNGEVAPEEPEFEADGYLPEGAPDYFGEEIWVNPETDPRFQFVGDFSDNLTGETHRQYQADLDGDGTNDYRIVVVEHADGSIYLDYHNMDTGENEARVILTQDDYGNYNAYFELRQYVDDPQGAIYEAEPEPEPEEPEFVADGYLPEGSPDYFLDERWPNPATDERFEFQYESHPQDGVTVRHYHADLDGDGAYDYRAVVVENPDGTVYVDYGDLSGNNEARVEVTQDANGNYGAADITYYVDDPQGAAPYEEPAEPEPAPEEDHLPDWLPASFDGWPSPVQEGFEYQYTGTGDGNQNHIYSNGQYTIMVTDYGDGTGRVLIDDLSNGQGWDMGYDLHDYGQYDVMDAYVPEEPEPEPEPEDDYLPDWLPADFEGWPSPVQEGFEYQYTGQGVNHFYSNGQYTIMVTDYGDGTGQVLIDDLSNGQGWDTGYDLFDYGQYSVMDAYADGEWQSQIAFVEPSEEMADEAAPADGEAAGEEEDIEFLDKPEEAEAADDVAEDLTFEGTAEETASEGGEEPEEIEPVEIAQPEIVEAEEEVAPVTADATDEDELVDDLDDDDDDGSGL